MLATEDYSGATPLHLGLAFLQVSDEATSGPVEESGMVFIFTPTPEAYQSHEEGDLSGTDDAEEEIEDSYDERMDSISRLKGRSRTQLCIDDWFLKHGARGKTARLLSRIQIMYVFLNTHPSKSVSHTDFVSNIDTRRLDA
jgi:hypothetical protein